MATGTLQAPGNGSDANPDRFMPLGKPVVTGSAPPRASDMDIPRQHRDAAFPYEQELGGPTYAAGLAKREYYASHIFAAMVGTVNEPDAALAVNQAIQLEMALKEKELQELRLNSNLSDAIALAAIRYCQDRRINLASEMPFHFEDLEIAEVGNLDYDLAAEHINFPDSSTRHA